MEVSEVQLPGEGAEVTAIAGADGKTPWVATNGLGLFRLNNDLRSEPFSTIFPKLDFRVTTFALALDGSTLLVGTADAGLAAVDLESNRVSVYGFDPQDPASLTDNRITTLLKGDQKTYWVGTEAA